MDEDIHRGAETANLHTALFYGQDFLDSLAPVSYASRRRGKSATKPGTLLRKQIPINTNQWDECRPGFHEADTVAHCGDSVMGMFANTVNFTDIATGWTEQRAVWGKGEKGVREQIKDVEKMLLFLLLGFDSGRVPQLSSVPTFY